MKITIQSLTLNNFKGIRKITIPFSERTTISGMNESGKTTIFDAFTWMLFGKNSIDVQAFNIKNTVDPELNKQDHIVEGILMIDGVETTLRRVYREKWVTKRGSSEQEFSGHETLFFKNDVPMSQSEYQEFINNILPESRFKLITNPYYFNNVLKKEERREMLISLVGEITTDQIIGKDKDLKELISLLETERKSIEELQKEYAAKKKLLQKSIDEFQPKIEENQRNIRPVPEVSQDAAKRLDEINRQIANASEGYNQMKARIDKRKSDMLAIEKEIADIEQEVKSGYSSDINAIDNQRHDLLLRSNELILKRDTLSQQITTLHEEEDRIKKSIEETRRKWFDQNNQPFTFDPSVLTCVYCKQPLPNMVDAEITLQRNFNENKALKLAEISKQGQELKFKLEKEFHESLVSKTEQFNQVKADIQEINKNLSLLDEKKAGIKTVSERMKEHEQLQQLDKQLASISADILTVPDNKTIIELQNEAKIYQEQINQVTIIEQRNNEAQKRITELNEQWKNLAQEKASLERIEFSIEKFISNKMNILESRLNGLFRLVTFRMYEKQVNGGYKPTCDTMVHGVPYPDTNHAGQINAGIDVINTFSRSLGILAPIFVDNSEAINFINDTDSQLIALRVTNETSLTVNNQ